MIEISPKVLDKLAAKHNVTPREVEQCFENRSGNLLTDTRENHRTNPPTLWFVAFTNKNRLLKVCFIDDGEIMHVRTCYEANAQEIEIYRRHGKPADF